MIETQTSIKLEMKNSVKFGKTTDAKQACIAWQNCQSDLMQREDLDDRNRLGAFMTGKAALQRILEGIVHAARKNNTAPGKISGWW